MTVYASRRTYGAMPLWMRPRVLQNIGMFALLAWSVQAFADEPQEPVSTSVSEESSAEDVDRESAEQTPSESRAKTPENAPDVTLPSSADAEPEPQVHYEDVVLRGAIGHVPLGEGTCTIQDGKKQTVVTYQDGLPQKAEKTHGQSHRERTDFSWDPERVLLERYKHQTQTRGPQSQGDSEWKTQNWFVEEYSWDELGRPEQVKHQQEGGENTAYECVWEDRRKGECTYDDGVKAEVELTAMGEIKRVRWSHATRRDAKRSLQGFWMRHLPTRLLRKGKIGSLSEKYRYDDDLRLQRFERRQRVLQGTRNMRWRLKRDRDGNVVEVERRCFGACSGVQNTKIYTIEYDEGFDNTFCGAWWDDSIDPTLKGW